MDGLSSPPIGHRPGITSVVADTIVLNGSTIEELELVLPTLREVLNRVNPVRLTAEEEAEEAQLKRTELERQTHSRKIRKAGDRLRFDSE